MSGPKVDSVELERQRKLAEALEIRKEKYNSAFSEFQLLRREASMLRDCYLDSCSDLFDFVCDEQYVLDMQNRLRTAYDSMMQSCTNVISYKMPSMDSRPSFSHESEEANIINQQRQAFFFDLEFKRQNFLSVRELCREKIKFFNTKKNAVDNLKQLISSLVELQEKVAVFKGTDFVVGDINQNVSKTNDLISSIQSMYPSDELNDVKSSCSSIVSNVNCFNQMMNRKIEEYSGIIEACMKGAEGVQNIQRVKELIEELTENLQKNTFLSDIEFEEWKELSFYEALEKDAKDQLDEVLDLIEATSQIESVSNENLEKLYEMYLALVDASKNNSASLIMLVSQFRIITQRINEKTVEFDECYNDYYNSCMLLNDITQSDSFKPLEREEFISFEDLEEEYNNIQFKLKEENKKLYIRQTIDEVMRSHGFNTTNEIVLRKNAAGTHLLSQKQDSDVGIHIYLGGQNQQTIMLEVVGTSKSAMVASDERNVIITDGAALSSQRQEQLFNEQKSFCDMHKEIVEELREKGIILDAIEHNPPSMEFCRDFALLTKSEIKAKEQVSYQRRTKKKEAPKEMALRIKKKAFTY